MSDASENVFGKIAISHKFMTPKQVNECLDIQARMRSYGLETKKIGEIAVERKFISRHQLDLILNIQKAIIAERQEKEKTASPPKTSEPVRKMRSTPGASPAPRRQAPVQQAHAPAARSKIDKYASEIKMGRITTIVCLGIAAIVVIFIVSRFGNGNGSEKPPRNNYPNSARNDEQSSPDLDAQRQQVARKRVEEADNLYRELKQWAAENRDKTEEISRRANRIIIDYAETDAAVRASLLADFYADLPEMPQEADAADQQKADSAWMAYRELSMEAARLRLQGKWGEAVAVYEKFPDKFADSRWYPQVQKQIRKLRQDIAKKYNEDLHVINRLIAAGKFEEARQYIPKIEHYASSDLVNAVRRELDSYISEADARPEETSPAKEKGEIAAEKIRVAENMFWRNMYLDAYNAYEELVEDPAIMSDNKWIRGRIKDLKRIFSVLDAVKKELMRSKGRRRKIPLEKEGSVTAKIMDINDYVITVFEKASGTSEIPMTDLTTNYITLHAKRILPREEAETEMALGTFLLSRGFKEEAEKHFFDAVKKNADDEEIKRLLARLQEKPGTKGPIAVADAGDESVEDSQEAKKKYDEAEKLFGDGKYAEALVIYRELLRNHLASGVVRQNRSQIDERIASCEERLVSPMARIFSGKVIERGDLGKGVVEVTYDFQDDKQLADWKEYNWYSIFDMHDSNWHIADGELQGNGSHGFLWKGFIDGDLKVEFDAYSTSADRQNIQATICDNGEGYNYLFALGLTELGSPKDIIRRNEKFSMGKEIAKRPSEAKSFETYHVKIVRQGTSMSLYVDDKLILKAKHGLYDKGHVGLFAIGSTVRFDNISIVGRLDRSWLAKQDD